MELKLTFQGLASTRPDSLSALAFRFPTPNVLEVDEGSGWRPLASKDHVGDAWRFADGRREISLHTLKGSGSELVVRGTRRDGSYCEEQVPNGVTFDRSGRAFTVRAGKDQQMLFWASDAEHFRGARLDLRYDGLIVADRSYFLLTAPLDAAALGVRQRLSPLAA